MTRESPSDTTTETDGHDLEALVRLPDFYHPVLSPDGERVAFYYDATGRNELYVQEVPTGDREQVSEGNVPRNAMYPIAWSRDGQRVYFHEDEDGDEQNDVHAIDVATGEREPVIVTEGQCVLEDVGPDGQHLLFTSTAREQKNLYRHDLESGENEQLTHYERPVWDAVFGPDGDRIAFVTNESADLENRDVYVADADGSNPRNLQVGETGAEAGVSDWAGDRLLVGDNSAELGRVGVYDLAGDDLTWYGEGDHEERPVRFEPDGGVLAMRTRECSIVPVRYDDPEGDGHEFALPEGVAAPTGAGTSRVTTAGGRVLTTLATAADRRELVAYDVETGDEEPVVAAEYGDFDPDGFVDAEYVTFESHDAGGRRPSVREIDSPGGLEIDGLLYDSGERPSPGIVLVHGGPHSQTLRQFTPVVQYLVSRGYSIFAPNYRGSTGRGRAFKNAVHGDWGGAEQGDVAAAGRWLMDRDWIDADRVAVAGGSYGGYSTYCQLTMYPELWATGVAIVGMTDLRRLYEESMPHFKSVLEEQLGDPGENEAFYRERSPISHVDDLQRPICVVHGVNDPRCPISQARLFREALEERGWTEGKDFEYHELGDEGHGSTDVEQRIRQYRILADYVERRL